MLYCTYDTLNMFWALLCPSSGALDYMCVIAAYSVQCLAAGCWESGAEQQAVRPGRGMLHEVQHPSSWTQSAKVKERAELYLFSPLGLRRLF